MSKIEDELSSSFWEAALNIWLIVNNKYHIHPMNHATTATISPNMNSLPRGVLPIVFTFITKPTNLVITSSTLIIVFTFILGFCCQIWSSMGLFWGSFSILSVFWMNSGFFIRFYMPGLLIISFIEDVSMLPPYIICDACASILGSDIIYWTMGLDIIWPIMPIMLLSVGGAVAWVVAGV